MSQTVKTYAVMSPQDSEGGGYLTLAAVDLSWTLEMRIDVLQRTGFVTGNFPRGDVTATLQCGDRQPTHSQVRVRKERVGYTGLVDIFFRDAASETGLSLRVTESWFRYGLYMGNHVKCETEIQGAFLDIFGEIPF